MSDTHGKDLVRRDAAHALEALGFAAAAAATLGTPIAGLAVGAVATAGKLALTRASDRREAKQEERSKTLIDDLQRRLRDVEARDCEETEVDLFAEMYMRAVEDDDSRKVVFHGAFIAWMVKEKRHPCAARLFGDAITQLTYEELRGFVHWGRNGGGFATDLYLQGTGLTDSVVYQRLDATGLLKQDGMRGTQFFSDIGKALVEECRSDQL